MIKIRAKTASKQDVLQLSSVNKIFARELSLRDKKVSLLRKMRMCQKQTVFQTTIQGNCSRQRI